MIDQRHYRKALEVIQRGMRPQYVYFALTDPECHDSVVKVGWTTDLVTRLSSLRAGGNSEPEWIDDLSDLHYIGYLIGDRELERHLHKAFSAHRLAGEWFTYEPIEEAINDLLDAHCVCDGCHMTNQLMRG